MGQLLGEGGSPALLLLQLEVTGYPVLEATRQARRRERGDLVALRVAPLFKEGKELETAHALLDEGMLDLLFVHVERDGA